MTQVGRRIADWFKGGDPEGPAKIRAWMTGDDGRPEGLTYSMAKPVTVLMVIAIILYYPTKGYGSIVALVLAIFVMGGRALIERQVRRDMSDLQEARCQYGRTRNPDYLTFMVLRAEGMLEDNMTLTRPTKAWLTEQVEWAKEQQAKVERRAAKKAARDKRRRSQEPNGDDTGATTASEEE